MPQHDTRATRYTIHTRLHATPRTRAYALHHERALMRYKINGRRVAPPYRLRGLDASAVLRYLRMTDALTRYTMNTRLRATLYTRAYALHHERALTRLQN